LITDVFVFVFVFADVLISFWDHRSRSS